MVLRNIAAHAFDFGVHAAGEHEPDHLEIADERPDRIFKRRRAIFFDNEMREPGERVTNNEEKREVVPRTARDEPNEQNYAERRSDEVQPARHCL